MSTLFDTLEYTKGAEQVGIVREHAEYQAKEIAKIFSYIGADVATKSDIKLIQSDIYKLEKSVLEKATKDDLKILKIELQSFFIRSLIASIGAIGGLLILFHFLKV